MKAIWPDTFVEGALTRNISLLRKALAIVHNSLRDTGPALKFAWSAVAERSDYLVYLRLEPQVGKLAGWSHQVSEPDRKPA